MRKAARTSEVRVRVGQGKKVIMRKSLRGEKVVPKDKRATQSEKTGPKLNKTRTSTEKTLHLRIVLTQHHSEHLIPPVTISPWELSVHIVTGIQLAPELTCPYRNYPYLYKGQIHAHSNESYDNDDGQTPWLVDYEYREKGYTFICLTDHNRVTYDPQVPGILHILSGEDGGGYRNHILVLGANFDLAIPYHYNQDWYRDSDLDGIDNHDTAPCEYIQPRIDYYTQIQKALAVLAHPNQSHSEGGSGFTEDELLSTWNYTGIEIFTSYDTESLCYWDNVLRRGRAIWGFGADDCHDVLGDNMLGNYMNFNRNWIVVNSDKSPDSDEATLRSDIIANIKAGNFYTVARCPRTLKDSFKEDTGTDGPSDIGVELHIAVIGPTLYAPTTVYVSTTRESTITFTGFRKIPRVEKFTDTYENKKEASYPINHSEIYVRVEIKQTGLDGQEYIAYSQPMFVIIPGPQ